MGVNIHAQEGESEYVSMVQRYGIVDRALSIIEQSFIYFSTMTLTDDLIATYIVVTIKYNIFRMVDLTHTRILQPWYWIDWLFYLMPIGREYKLLLDDLHRYTREVRTSITAFHRKLHVSLQCSLLYISKRFRVSQEGNFLTNFLGDQ